MSELAYVLIADHSPQAFAPMSEVIPLPLMPFAGKALISHWLDLISSHASSPIYVIIDGHDQVTAGFIHNKWPQVRVGDRYMHIPAQHKLVMAVNQMPMLRHLHRIIEQAKSGQDMRSLALKGHVIYCGGREHLPVPNDFSKYIRNDLILSDLHSYMNMSFAFINGYLTNHLGDVNSENRSTYQPWFIAPNADLGADVMLKQNGMVCEGAIVGAGTLLENVIVLPCSLVEPKSELVNCIIAQEWIYSADKGAVERRYQRPSYHIH
jgi:NDP-sugar pyrophosphorylase family protein